MSKERESAGADDATMAAPAAASAPAGKAAAPGASDSAETLPAPARAADGSGDNTLEAPGGLPAPVRMNAPRDLGALQESDPSNYVLGFELARGGMGRIVTARDRRLGRPVAIKELLPQSGADVRRFEREAMITARLQHPSIVRVYEAGRWPSGLPFYAMEMVTGRSFDAVIADATAFDARLALLPHVIQVAEALAYAHAQKIIHRDLKPSNVLVGSFGQTIVIDWGLAKDLLDDSPDEVTAPARGSSSGLTMAGAVLGTPAYMAPEQARGKKLDERADVYAIGAILYSLLAGHAPYMAKSADEVLIKVAAGPPPAVETLQPGVPQELASIVRTAMATDPKQRYATARQLCDELKRFQTGQLVASHVYSKGQLVTRFIRRHRTVVLAGVLAVTAITAVSVVSIRRVVAARDLAERQRRAAVASRVQAEIQRERAERRSDDLTLGQANAALASDPTRALAWLKLLSAGSPVLPLAKKTADEAHRLGVARILSGHSDDLGSVRFAAGGKLVSSSDDHTVRVWDGPQAQSRVLSGHDAAIEALAISRDGHRAATGSVDRTVRVWNLGDGSSRMLTGHTGTVRTLAFTPDGSRLVSGSEDGTIRVWDLVTDASRAIDVGAGAPVRMLTLSLDGTRVFAVTEAGRLGSWELATLKGLQRTAHAGIIRMVALSADGASLATAGEDRAVKLWRVPTLQPIRELYAHKDVVRDVCFSPDGKYLASGGGGNDVRLWDLATFESRVLGGNDAGIKELSWSADSRWLASAGADTTVRIWDIASGADARVFRGHAAAVKSVAFSPDNRALASGSDDDSIRWWSLTAEPPPADAAALPLWLDGATNMSLAAKP